MEVSIRHELDVVVATVTGEMDAATVAPIESITTGLLEDVPASDVAFDLARVSFIDSAGLVYLAELAKRLDAKGLRLQVRNPSGRTRQLLVMTGVADLVELVPRG